MPLRCGDGRLPMTGATPRRRDRQRRQTGKATHVGRRGACRRERGCRSSPVATTADSAGHADCGTDRSPATPRWWGLMEGLATHDPNPRTGETRLLPRSADPPMAGRLLCRGPREGQRGEVTASTPANTDREINSVRQACTEGDDASLGTNRRHIAFGHAQHNRPHRRSPHQQASVQAGGELSPPLHRARVGGAEQLQ